LPTSFCRPVLVCLCSLLITSKDCDISKENPVSAANNLSLASISFRILQSQVT
jgi:hypothetical protein